MGRVSLKSVELQAFACFTGKERYNFPASGTLLVRGKNKDTGSRSAAGKSSFLKAICYPFDYPGIPPATELQSWEWLTEEKMLVQHTLATDQGEARLYRGKGVYVLETEHGTYEGEKSVQAELQKLIGMPASLLAALTYVKQGSGGLFLALGDTDKKSFLCDVIPALAKYEEEEAAALKRANELEKKLIEAEGKVSLLTEQFGKLTKPVPPVFPSADNERKFELVRKISAAEADLYTFNNRLSNALALLAGDELLHKNKADARMRELVIKKTQAKKKAESAQITSPELEALEVMIREAKSRIDDLIELDATQKRSAKEQLKLKGEELKELLTKSQRKRNLTEDFRKTQAEIAKLSTNKCPQCDQDLPGGEILLERAKTKLKAIHEELKGLVNVAADVERVSEEINALQNFEENPDIKLEKTNAALLAQRHSQLKDKLTKEALSTNAELLQIETEIAAAEYENREGMSKIRHYYGLKIDPIRADINKLQEEVDEAEKELVEIKLKLNKYTFDHQFYEQVQRSYELADLSRALAAEERDLYKSKLAAELDYAALVGREGFLGLVFDEVLADIARETNEVLDLIPNVAHLSIQFKSEVTAKNGNVQRKIVPVVYSDGHPCTLNQISGGMRKALDFAIDIIAIPRVVSQRTGSYPAWHILDEPFNGLTEVERSVCMAILDEASRERLIIVVDHDTETKELFTQAVDIVLTNKIARIQGPL
jgi:DNA repair exonuclease SbcCD ATPase subunit